jgi:hypothetical protein
MAVPVPEIMDIPVRGHILTAIKLGSPSSFRALYFHETQEVARMKVIGTDFRPFGHVLA